MKLKVGDKVIVDSLWVPSSVPNKSEGTIIKAENYPTAGWVVEFSNGTRGTFEENELTPATIASNVKGKDVTITIDGKKFNPYSNFEYEMDFYNTKEEKEKEEESEGDALLRFFATPAGKWKGKDHG